MNAYRRYEVQFFTATILEWKKLLRPDKYKEIVIDSLKYLSRENRVIIPAFVIMSNHLHRVWHIRHPHLRSDVQRDFLRYTTQQIKFDLMDFHPQVLPHFKVDAKDRQYPFRERNPLSIGIFSEAVLRQKIEHIHENLVKAGLINSISAYPYSSACFYETGIDRFGFLVEP